MSPAKQLREVVRRLNEFFDEQGMIPQGYLATADNAPKMVQHLVNRLRKAERELLETTKGGFLE